MAGLIVTKVFSMKEEASNTAHSISTKERVMPKTMTKNCQCDELDDDLKAEGWTCYNCYDQDNE